MISTLPDFLLWFSIPVAGFAVMAFAADWYDKRHPEPCEHQSIHRITPFHWRCAACREVRSTPVFNSGGFVSFTADGPEEMR